LSRLDVELVALVTGTLLARRYTVYRWKGAVLVTDDGAKKINDAIKACLSICYDAESPLTTVAAFLSQLRATPGWNDADADLVEIGVHRMLKMIVRRSSSGEFEPVVKQPQNTSQGQAQRDLVDQMNEARPPVETSKPSETTPSRRSKQPNKRHVNG